VRTARPSRQAGIAEGAVKNADLLGFRVLSFSSHLLLVVACSVHAALPCGRPNQLQRKQVKTKASAKKLRKSKKTTCGNDSAATPFKARGTIHFDVDLALFNVTVTDPYNRLSPAPKTDQFPRVEDSIEQEVVNLLRRRCAHPIGVIFDFSAAWPTKSASAPKRPSILQDRPNPQDEFFLVSFNERAE